MVEKHNRKALEDDDNGLVTIDASVPPGRDVRCIISVAMLSEGWDATTVTHVVGLRPFGSQLLCEQVVGRALRRTSYAVDEATGFFREETAKVFGVPFELIPFKVEGGAQQPPSPPANQIYAVPAKAQFELAFPVVEGYTDPGVTRLTMDWPKVPTLELNPMTVPDVTLMKGLTTQDGALAAYGPGAADVVNLDQWRAKVRVQQVAFTMAKVLTQQWLADRGDVIPTHRLFPQLLGYTTRFLAEKLKLSGNRAPQDVALNPYFQQAVGILFDSLVPVDESGKTQERPIIVPGPAGERSTRHVEFFTGRQPWPVQKCQPPSPSQARMSFILGFLESTGLRSTELLMAKLGDLSKHPEGWVMQVHGKGAKNRWVALPPQAIHALEAYLNARGHGPMPGSSEALPLLASSRDPSLPIGYQALYESVRRWLGRAVEACARDDEEKARYGAASTHWLRHTFGTKAVAKGVPLDVVQAQMGHASVNTTMNYSRAPVTRRLDELSKVFAGAAR